MKLSRRYARRSLILGFTTVLTLNLGTALPPSEAQQHSTAGHGQSAPASSSPKPADPQTQVMTISPERLQSIGVKFALAKRRPLDKVIRTVGQVEIDERQLAHVNIKLEGWIDDLLVSSTGERVKKGQILFTLYSPELVATLAS